MRTPFSTQTQIDVVSRTLKFWPKSVVVSKHLLESLNHEILENTCYHAVFYRIQPRFYWDLLSVTRNLKSPLKSHCVKPALQGVKKI